MRDVRCPVCRRDIPKPGALRAPPGDPPDWYLCPRCARMAPVTTVCPAVPRRQTFDERRIFLDPPDSQQGMLLLLRPSRDECLLLSWSAVFVLSIRARLPLQELLTLLQKT